MKVLHLSELRRVNLRRRRRWHGVGTEEWSGADWSNAMCGEAGETANVVKKLRRHETGTAREGAPEVDVLRKKLAHEIADIVIYADLLAAYYGIDLSRAVVEKFNKDSEKNGFPERLVGGTK